MLVQDGKRRRERERERDKLGILLAGSRNQEEASVTGAAWAKRRVVEKTSENLLEVRS